MKFGVKTQGLKEFIGVKLNLFPAPVLHTNMYAHCARAICDAVALGVFESIGRGGERTCEDIAASTDLNARALETLLNVLVSVGYLRHKRGRFRLSPLAGKWLLKESDSSIHDAVLMFRNQWKLYEHLPTYLKTGKGTNLHETVGRGEWSTYQNAMFQFARLGVREIVRKMRVPKSATSMLDIGGSHGLFSVELCKKVPSMRSVVLDLPEAVEAAAPILAAINSELRVRHQPGNILTDDIGEAWHDIILMADLAHHLTPEQNMLVARKASRALKNGGYFVIQDFVRPTISNDSDTICSIQNLFFGLTSSVGTYTVEEQQSWQRQAGLHPVVVVRYISAPIHVQVVAQKRA